jgi:hypothetical protein
MHVALQPVKHPVPRPARIRRVPAPLTRIAVCSGEYLVRACVLPGSAAHKATTQRASRYKRRGSAPSCIACQLACDATR